MDVAVVVNLRARLGSEAIGRMVREHLPRARVTLTRSLDDVHRWLERDIAPRPPALLLSGGGDGTAVTLLNELRTRRIDVARIGLLRLGTGNGLANVTGSPRARQAIARIAALGARTPPTRRFSLVESDGRVAPFLGTGWDAEIISDFKAQATGLGSGIVPALDDGLPGYLKGLFTRTFPRHLFGPGPPMVTVTNLGEPALTVDERGRVVPMVGGGTGQVLYRGPASVAGVATSEEFGFGVRAFPFAHAAPGRVNVRIYAARAFEAGRNMLKIWRGQHPLANMHDFFLTRGRMEFDREVPFQVGGDLASPRRSFEFGIAQDSVELVDWSQLAAA